MKTSTTTPLLCTLSLLAACGLSDRPDDSTLQATWTFEDGDCDTLDVATVRITASEEGGDALEGEFPCADEIGELGQIPEGGATYSVEAEGLDAQGEVRAESFGQTASYPDGVTLTPLDITLRAAAGDVVVSWDGCPPAVVIPYYVSIYELPAEGSDDELGEQVSEVQESCSSSEATLMRIAPGDYIVEVDSRAVQPAVRDTAPVTVVPGEDAAVSVMLLP